MLLFLSAPSLPIQLCPLLGRPPTWSSQRCLHKPLPGPLAGRRVKFRLNVRTIFLASRRHMVLPATMVSVPNPDDSPVPANRRHPDWASVSHSTLDVPSDHVTGHAGLDTRRNWPVSPLSDADDDRATRPRWDLADDDRRIEDAGKRASPDWSDEVRRPERESPDWSGEGRRPERESPDWSGEGRRSERESRDWSGEARRSERESPDWSGERRGRQDRTRDGDWPGQRQGRADEDRRQAGRAEEGVPRAGPHESASSAWSGTSGGDRGPLGGESRGFEAGVEPVPDTEAPILVLDNCWRFSFTGSDHTRRHLDLPYWLAPTSDPNHPNVECLLMTAGCVWIALGRALVALSQSLDQRDPYGHEFRQSLLVIESSLSLANAVPWAVLFLADPITLVHDLICRVVRCLPSSALVKTFQHTAASAGIQFSVSFPKGPQSGPTVSWVNAESVLPAVPVPKLGPPPKTNPPTTSTQPSNSQHSLFTFRDPTGTGQPSRSGQTARPEDSEKPHYAPQYSMWVAVDGTLLTKTFSSHALGCSPRTAEMIGLLWTEQMQVLSLLWDGLTLLPPPTQGQARQAVLDALGTMKAMKASELRELYKSKGPYRLSTGLFRYIAGKMPKGETKRQMRIYAEYIGYRFVFQRDSWKVMEIPKRRTVLNESEPHRPQRE